MKDLILNLKNQINDFIEDTCFFEEEEKQEEKELEEKNKNTKMYLKQIAGEDDIEKLRNFGFQTRNCDTGKVYEEIRNKISSLELEKKKKYKDFLAKNKITQDLLDSGVIIKKTDEKNKTISFYKKIDVFNY